MNQESLLKKARRIADNDPPSLVSPTEYRRIIEGLLAHIRDSKTLSRMLANELHRGRR